MFEKALPFGPPRGKRSFADRRTPAFVAVLAQSNRSRIPKLATHRSAQNSWRAPADLHHKNPGAFTRAWSRFELAPHRRLEWQICVATALALHTDPWPVTFSPLPIEWSRACPALAGSRSQTPGLPLICPADWVAEESAGVSLASACFRKTHNFPCSKYQREIDGVQSAPGADRFALRRRGARALGFAR